MEDDLSRAYLYLIGSGYEDVRAIKAKRAGLVRIAYTRDSGDGSWEDRASKENGWMLDENKGCCREKSLNNIRGQLIVSNFCGECGAGVNATISYSKESDNLENNLSSEQKESLDESNS